MSVQVLSWAFAQDVQPASHKLVLIALANRSDEDGFCYPSYRWISQQTSQSESTCKRAVENLIEQGFIQKSERYREDGTQDRNLYQLLIGGGGCQIDTLGCQNDMGRGSPVTPHNTKINKKNKKHAHTREEFLREVDEGVKEGRFDETLKRYGMTGEIFMLCAGDAWDYWKAYDKFPEDLEFGLKGWAKAWRVEATINQKRIENVSRSSDNREETEWAVRVSTWQKTKFWPDQFGPPPDKFGTRVPNSILTKYQINQPERQLA